MFGRPRCREWTPLATQQLRLRSLIQIVGYNIRPPEECYSPCSFYYTLHHTTMSAPFYTSEKITSPHPKWKEIDSEITLRMSSTNIVIRIWCHTLQTATSDDRAPDSIIQTWGIYFTGLRFIGANLSLNFTSDSFKYNTLVLQMHGGYFCSYKSLKLEVIPPENELEYGSISSESSVKTNASSKISIQNRLTRDYQTTSPGKCSKKTEKEYSKSYSPIERGFKQNYPNIRPSASLNIGHSKRSNDLESDIKNIIEHSPDSFNVAEFTCDPNCDSAPRSLDGLHGSKIDLSETAENYDIRSESDGTPKYRYMALSFLKSEIRPGYNAAKLQKLHLLQYSIKKRQEAVQEVKERIYHKTALTNSEEFLKQDDAVCKLKPRKEPQKSLFSLTDDDFRLKCSKDSQNGKIKTDNRPITSNGPRLALKLNDLLSFKSKPSPLQRAEHVRLTKQLEILRFKKIILSDERDAKLSSIRRLKEKLAKLYEENQDMGLITGSELMQGFHALSKRTEALKETRLSANALRELAARTHSSLASQRSQLLMGLERIFYIEEKDPSTWTICGIPLPICGDENHRRSNYLSESVAAGFAAQATSVVAAILNQPPRYRITLKGSESKIMDLSPELPDPNVPLYARGGDVTMFRYALFLLNKCIVQLMWARGVHVTDLRPTLTNLKRLMTSKSNVHDTSKLFGSYRWLDDVHYPRAQSLRSLVASDRGKYRQFNRFKDSVDGQCPQSLMSLQRHRHSRSVGSYHDDQDLAVFDLASTSIMGSEPSLYNPCATPITPDVHTKMLKHSSDSEISRISSEQDIEQIEKVTFTLGDDRLTKANVARNLVRISCNNGDGGENFQQICTEIADFCATKVDRRDATKHMDENDVNSAVLVPSCANSNSVVNNSVAEDIGPEGLI